MINEHDTKIIKEILNTSTVFCLIKGTKEEPKCKFSKALVNLLNENNVTFNFFNVLSVKEMGLYENFKLYSNYPTFPQVFVNGEFIGGLDIIKEEFENGVFMERYNILQKKNVWKFRLLFYTTLTALLSLIIYRNFSNKK
jgi:Grx4 family monothiol glutaredoxin